MSVMHDAYSNSRMRQSTRRDSEGLADTKKYLTDFGIGQVCVWRVLGARRCRALAVFGRRHAGQLFKRPIEGTDRAVADFECYRQYRQPAAVGEVQSCASLA